jgi:hypothetical protein
MPPPKLITFAFLLVILAGCQSHDFNHVTSPEVVGRVVAADTHQPLANVRVRRPGANEKFEPSGPPKGGQVLIQLTPVRTDADGRFVLASQSTFALFASPGWWTVPVSYECAGYEGFTTNYTASDVISNTPSGPPVINVGDVLLQPLAK